MKVAVVGAGIAGLALALQLHRRGVACILLEQAGELSEVGAGLQLSPNAARILVELGLEASLRAAATAPDSVEVRDGTSGRLRLRLPLGPAAQARWGAPYLEAHRADLQRLLLDAVRARGAARIRLGVRVGDLDAIEADVVVGADGARSAVREALFPGRRARPSGVLAWRALVGLPPGAQPPAGVRVWVWPGRHLVAYPVSGGAPVNLVALTPGALPGEGWSEPADPGELRVRFADAHAAPGALLAAVQTATRWSAPVLDPLPAWSRGAATLVGDAAHPLLPFLAQGAAMALEDGEALARALAERPSIPAALAAYEAERRPRAARVQAASATNGRIFHLPGPLSAAAFAAAGVIDAARGGPAARMDWLYGHSRPGRAG